MDHRTPVGVDARPSPEELRARRRAARAAGNRSDILDAAERAFAERGLDGSLREIAQLSGFSTAAIYKYFDSKQQLFAETLSRRGLELLQVIEQSAEGADGPMDKLHAIVDGAIGFFESFPDFGRMLRSVRETGFAIPEVIRDEASERIEEFTRSVALMVGIVEAGQQAGEIRNGSASALLHFYMTLVYEHVFLLAPDNPAPSLGREEFHELIDGALRRP
jgi:AcrR family transcriptional regulator